MSKTPLAQFKREHHNSNALLGQQGPHKAIEWVLRNVNPFHGASFTSQDPNFPLQKRAQQPLTITILLSVAALSCQQSSIILSSACQKSKDFPINIICRYSKLQSQLLTRDVWQGEVLLETHIPNFSPVLCHSASWWTQGTLNTS